MKTKLALSIAILAASALASVPAFAKGSGGRTNYGGSKHTSSHGGHYKGGSGGSSHKGGTYSNPKGGKEYGKHRQ